MATSLFIFSFLALLILAAHAFDPSYFFRKDNQNQDTGNQNVNQDGQYNHNDRQQNPVPVYGSQNQNNREVIPNSNTQYDNNNYGTQNTQDRYSSQNNQNRNQDNFQNQGNRQDTPYEDDRRINNQDTRRNDNQGNRNQDRYINQNNQNRNQDNFQNQGNRPGTPYDADRRINNQGNRRNEDQGNRHQNNDNENGRQDSKDQNKDSKSRGEGKNGDSKVQNQGGETTTSKNIFKKIGKGIENEIKDIKQPVLAGVVSVASSQCDNLKKIAGVAYEQLDDEDEPDVSQLTLRFICGSYNITYNITTAAREIPAARNHDPSQRLYIFLHGFTDDPTKSNYNTIRQGLFSEGRNNVLGLDASALIKWMYLRSTTYVQFIGEKLGEVLAAMVHGGVHRSKIHIIGHSLGAHIAGFTGKQFLTLTGSRVGRISGLDPAGPCFAHVNDSQRLNATDAEFVDVIHTDSGVYGIKEPVGQVDYFPNEGKSQPGCFFETCSHSRAVQLFADSIQNPESFPAVKCDSWEGFEKGQCEREQSLMGFPSKPGTRGKFYLQTGEEAPFGKGEQGTKYNNKKGVVKTITQLLG